MTDLVLDAVMAIAFFLFGFWVFGCYWLHKQGELIDGTKPPRKGVS